MNNIVAGLAATWMLQLCFFFFNMCFVLLPRTIVVHWWYSRILITTLKVRAAFIDSRQKLLPFHITLEISNISNFIYQTFWSKLNKLFKKRKLPIKDFEWSCHHVSFHKFYFINCLRRENFPSKILNDHVIMFLDHVSSNPERHSYQS